MIRKIPLWGFAAAFAVQAGLLGYMLVARASLLANGAEIRLPVVPVDPRDFLRGDYVILSYPMSTLKPAELAGDDDFGWGDNVHVELAQDGEIWKPVALHKAQPEGATSILGTITNISYPANCTESSCAVLSADYNLEKFFVPEGEGRALETLRNDQRVEVDAVLSGTGRAMLKRLRVDGEIKYEESLL
jgi:uncharacterized membrane-anchored protein